MQIYELKVAGITRQLVKCPLNEKIDIAGFIMLGDVELTVACAEELLKKSPKFDVIFTAEAKSIPLAYEMARQSGKPYVVARKSKKLYMYDTIETTVRSITTDNIQKLYLSGAEIEIVKGKNVLIVDDVVSLGDSLRAMEELVQSAGGNIVGKAFVLAEDKAAERDDIIFLEKLPLFFK
ncbi:MAG: adenine phosphoribosyltransferase [Oscillospiraceae bacterium]|jgi:adenine phosphoribosyltransferase|nr:adenine phosphoribosyltransferase [Oscillospiraceae bacterium]